jgi:DNA-binding beta-propeller fold protein YncE
VRSLFAAAVLCLASWASAASAQPAPAAPEFTFDTTWMHVPPQYVLGDVSAVAVDRADNVWVLHRPRSVAEDQRAKAAPPVLEFDKNGTFIRGWGGAGEGFDWPANEHTIFVDDKNRVWITGNSRTAPVAEDDAILTFTADGKFLRQIGKDKGSKGDLDTENVKAAADLFVDTKRRELYAADGYGNRRVIVFDSETGKFKRMWGAFGNPPPSTPMGPPLPARRPEGAPDQVGEGAAEFRSVHGVEVAKDGTVYVSDRDSQRVQVFDRNGRYMRQVFIDRNAPSRQTASGLGLSADKAQRYLYVLNFGNCHIEVLDRKTLETAKTLGECGSEPGQFRGPHLMAVNSKGVIYVAETTGRRVQRITPR